MIKPLYIKDDNYVDALKLLKAIKSYNYKDVDDLIAECNEKISDLKTSDTSSSGGDDSRETSSMDHDTSSEAPGGEVSNYEPSTSKDEVSSPYIGHVHSFVNHSGKKPTCTESGYADYKTCDGCGYSDYRSIPALSHQYVLSEKREATCDENGYTEYKCANCGDSYKETVYSTGHDLAPATCLAPSTCKKCGKQFGAVGEHEYNVHSMDYYGHYYKTGVQCKCCGKFNPDFINRDVEIRFAKYPRYDTNADYADFKIDENGHCIIKVNYTEDGTAKTEVLDFYLRNESFNYSAFYYDCYDKYGEKIDDMIFYCSDYSDNSDYMGRAYDIGIDSSDYHGYDFNIWLK